MTDLGTISTRKPLLLRHRHSYIAGLNLPSFSIDFVAGSISVTVKVAGTVKPFSRTAIYSTRTNKLIQIQKSNAAGEATFTDLPLDEEYYVVATDTGSYNALIYDKLTPV